MYDFISGIGIVHLDGAEHRVVPGSVVFIPGDTSQYVRNAGSQTLTLLFVFAVDRFADGDTISPNGGYRSSSFGAPACTPPSMVPKHRPPTRERRADGWGRTFASASNA